MNMIEILKQRFMDNMERHIDTSWESVAPLIEHHLKAIQAMEDTGGEPAIFKLSTGLYVIDASTETPKERRNVCYDKDARIHRKKFAPESSALEDAKKMGVTLLNEAQYLELQTMGNFDLKSSSWILTPKDVRALGGALFGDKRYNRCFVYHNGADSYYAARGYRVFVKLI